MRFRSLHVFLLLLTCVIGCGDAQLGGKAQRVKSAILTVRDHSEKLQEAAAPPTDSARQSRPQLQQQVSH